ncbi:MAG: hypothetical protein E6J34_17510 [Chloroflexi bacterium]|nr:MAG: hypothetical protein E6J34_17510 [Chloroflexota bacterium]
MIKEQRANITPLYERLPEHIYEINCGWNNSLVHLSTQTLLDIAAYVEANRYKLEQETSEGTEQQQRTQKLTTTSKHQIKQEWRYMTNDLLL